MHCLSKGFLFVLILVIAIASLSLLLIKPASGQSIPTPLVPEFTVKFVGTFSIPFIGYSLPTVNITIKNQPFTPYTDQHGNKINLYYIIQWKENSSNSWQQTQIPLNESNSNYTETNLGLIRSEAPSPTGQVDFQVEAVIGYITYNSGSVPQGEYIPPAYIGEFSGWSNTQTVAVPENSALTSTSKPALLVVPLTATVVFVATLVAVAISLEVYSRQRKSTETTQ
jgi:hypothetical protein